MSGRRGVLVAVRDAPRHTLRGVTRRARELPRRVRRRALVVTGALALIGLAAVIVGYLVWIRPLDATDDARTDGLDAARARIEQTLSFAPQSADEDLGRARENVTGDFATQFSGLLGGVVEPALRQGLATRTTATRASVVSAVPDRAVVLVFLDQQSTTGTGPPRVTKSRAEVTVEFTGGQWLIAGLRNL